MAAGDWYRHAMGTERGQMAEQNGQTFIVVEFEGRKLRRAYREQDWIPEKEARPLSRMQVAEIAHAADLFLCKLRRIPTKVSPWIGLTDKERLVWRDKGPQLHPERAAVWKAIFDTLKPEVD